MSVLAGLRGRIATSASVFGILAAIVSAHASTSENVLHKFQGASDGSIPQAGLIADSAGNLYGTTAAGGGGTGCDDSKLGCGTVFEIPVKGKETVLHAFAGGCDGAFPVGVVKNDSQDNLYGTTEGGGICNNDGGYGTVFKLAPGGAESLLYAFQGATDGNAPLGNISLDPQGNVYGATEFGGNVAVCGFGCGVVFEVTPTGAETVVHAFQGGADGLEPLAGVIMDGSGNLFGTTDGGGGSGNCPAGCGTVFEIAPDGTETVLYAFQGGTDGAFPRSSLILDGAGDLYGTTEAGGSNGYGTVFEVTPTGSETILHSFKAGSDGDAPLAGLAMDNAGNLYGTTFAGGGTQCKHVGCGTIFEVTAKGKEKVLYSFHSTHGRNPAAGLLPGAHDKLYGTTMEGGKDNNGVVFELEK
ncbi:MAG TPA: choice-of-anchor tandem repeat GloVer-containing protein [Rhizomicrobium sp.]|jgi:uncharacterized repeat protein (TIGR03803 family)|nr:choice-of-anchor tandem repeat GloVer-containing protein [Rhizomicrobium sp.]